MLHGARAKVGAGGRRAARKCALCSGVPHSRYQRNRALHCTTALHCNTALHCALRTRTAHAHSPTPIIHVTKKVSHSSAQLPWMPTAYHTTTQAMALQGGRAWGGSGEMSCCPGGWMAGWVGG